MKIEKGKSSKKEKITQNMNPVGWVMIENGRSTFKISLNEITIDWSCQIYDHYISMSLSIKIGLDPKNEHSEQDGNSKAHFNCRIRLTIRKERIPFKILIWVKWGKYKKKVTKFKTTVSFPFWKLLKLLANCQTPTSRLTVGSGRHETQLVLLRVSAECDPCRHTAASRSQSRVHTARVWALQSWGRVARCTHSVV